MQNIAVFSARTLELQAHGGISCTIPLSNITFYFQIKPVFSITLKYVVKQRKVTVWNFGLILKAIVCFTV